MEKQNKQLYVEIVTERIFAGPRGITASSHRRATKKDIEAAKIAHKKKNPHDNEKTTVFYDEAGFMYDFRKCGICDNLIAMI